jgi:ADP-ribose pyrophosphatase
VTGERDLARGSLVRLVELDVTGPSGASLRREVVRHPGAVIVVALEGDGVWLVRQYRAAVDREVLELPAGKRDVAGEPPDETARRELVEEVGRRASLLRYLGRFYNSPGFTDEETFCYLATELEPVEREPQGLEERHMAAELIAWGVLDRLAREGTLCDAKTLAGLALARGALGGPGAADGAAGR